MFPKCAENKVVVVTACLKISNITVPPSSQSHFGENSIISTS